MGKIPIDLVFDLEELKSWETRINYGESDLWVGMWTDLKNLRLRYVYDDGSAG